MRYVSVFSGIEAASVAWEGLGWEPVAFSEIDTFPSTVLAHRYPDVPNLGDITQIKWKRYRGKVDLVVGGSPCQSFSIAGKREGLDGASGLMWEYVRAIREIRPRWLLWENVPGALSSSRGEDFRCLLDSLGDLGYGLAWRVLDAQFFGVAQRRRRLFVVGRLGGEPPVEVLFERGSLSGDFKTGRAERARIASRSEGGADGGRSVVAFAQNSRDEVRYQGGGDVSRSNGLGVGESDVMPTLDTSPSSAVVYGISYMATCASEAVGFDVAPAIKAARADTSVVCAASGQARAAVCRDLAPTLDASHEQPIVTAKTAVVRCGAPGGGKGALVSDDVSLTLSTGNEQTLFAPAGRRYVVRRLTPTECERLQGFPDGWTKVPYRGKPAEECPDAPRYKALGNSMAAPVMRWIGERIALVESCSMAVPVMRWLEERGTLVEPGSCNGCSVPAYSDGEPIMPGDIVRHPDMHDSRMVTEVVLGLHGAFVRCMCGFETMRHDLFRRADTPASLADEIDEWIDTEQDPDDPYEPLHGIAERLRKMGEES